MAKLIESPDEIQDWERREESGDGNLGPEELQLVAEARIAVPTRRQWLS
jgi:hypothetical protein